MLAEENTPLVVSVWAGQAFVTFKGETAEFLGRQGLGAHAFLT